jgi:MFS family permease
MAYAWYAVAVLTLVYVFSFLDRFVLNLLIQPVRRDLDISDTGMSLLTGFSFAVFYTVFGLPLSRLADSHSRRGLIAAGFVIWSLFTAGCGLARNFSQLLAMRMGVGVGEASLSPAAYSMIVDYFPPQKRSTALSVYVTGSFVGAGIAYVLGGLVVGLTAAHPEYVLPLIGSVRSWQLVFFIVGLPGLLLALLLFTIAEPARTGAGAGTQRVPLHEAYLYFRTHRSAFLTLILGAGMLDFSIYGAGTWIPTFYIRQHHLTAQTIGTLFGIELAVLGPLGLLCGGWVADRLGRNRVPHAPMLVCLAASILGIPGLSYLLLSSTGLSIVFLGPAVFVAALPLGCVKAALMEITPARMRSQAGALLLFVTNLVGLGMGSASVALLTDHVFHDDNMVGSSLLAVMAFGQIAAAALFWAGLKPFVHTKAHLQDMTPSKSP